MATAAVGRPVRKRGQMAVADTERTSIRTMPCELSRLRSREPRRSAVKLRPAECPDSNFVRRRRQRLAGYDVNVDARLPCYSLYSPVRGLSVPSCWVIRRCSRRSIAVATATSNFVVVSIAG